MYDTYVKRLYQRTYDGILATPVDVHELFLAEATWIAVRSGVFGCAPLIIAMAFGLPPSWGMLAVPFIGVPTGLGFALMGHVVLPASCRASTSFTYVQSALVTPLLLLVSGIFFPITGFPQWVQTLAEINPLYHCVNLVRDAVFAWQWSALSDVAVLRALRRCHGLPLAIRAVAPHADRLMPSRRPSSSPRCRRAGVAARGGQGMSVPRRRRRAQTRARPTSSMHGVVRRAGVRTDRRRTGWFRRAPCRRPPRRRRLDGHGVTDSEPVDGDDTSRRRLVARPRRRTRPPRRSPTARSPVAAHPPLGRADPRRPGAAPPKPSA